MRPWNIASDQTDIDVIDRAEARLSIVASRGAVRAHILRISPGL